MALARWDRVHVMAVGWVVLACNGGGSAPPGPPSDLVKSGGDAQSWYFNNPLPTPLSVTAVDVDGRGVPGVVVTWSVASGGGAVSPLQSTTNASGIATTTDSIGSPATSTRQTVNATFTGSLGPATFSEFGTLPPTTADVSVADFSFSPQAVVIQTGGTVTWTWGGAAPHDVSYDGGPTPLPTGSGAPKTTGTHQNTITPVGRYTYHCSVHAGMTGSVTVVH
jgi:plastocyanin